MLNLSHSHNMLLNSNPPPPPPPPTSNSSPSFSNPHCIASSHDQLHFNNSPYMSMPYHYSPSASSSKSHYINQVPSPPPQHPLDSSPNLRYSLNSPSSSNHSSPLMSSPHYVNPFFKNFNQGSPQYNQFNHINSSLSSSNSSSNLNNSNSNPSSPSYNRYYSSKKKNNNIKSHENSLIENEEYINNKIFVGGLNYTTTEGNILFPFFFLIYNLIIFKIFF